MHRAVTVTVVLAVLVGSVPAAATLAGQSPSESEPGAAFAGVVGVQEAEVNSEVADRSFEERMAAAGSNASKASVVATESDQIADRLDELEAEKARLQAAYENGSISKGEYEARLAVVAAELRVIERQANQTADAAETLPEEALREQGANVSEVHEMARQANESRGEEVAEAARSIAGEDAGGDPGSAPENTSDRGEDGTNPNSADADNGPPTDRQNGSDQSSEAGPPVDGDNESGESSEAGNPSDSEIESQRSSDRGSDAGNPSDTANGTEVGNEGNEDDAENGTDAGNRSENRSAERPGEERGNESAANGTEASPTESNSSIRRTLSGFSRDIASQLPTDWVELPEGPKVDMSGG